MSKKTLSRFEEGVLTGRTQIIRLFRGLWLKAEKEVKSEKISKALEGKGFLDRLKMLIK